MIQMPQRSVTRFFIPLIDVLILLFCIFLLMPLFKAQAGPGTQPSPDDNPSAQEPKDGNETAEQLRAEIERLRKEQGKPLQERLAVRVLQIDPDNGVLFYNDPQRIEIRSEADAHDLIVRDRQAIGDSGRELYYEILYPRDPASRFPLARQRKDYDAWFKDVAHGWDIPGAPLKGGKG